MLAERMNTFSGSPTSALIAKVAELRAEGKDIISLLLFLYIDRLYYYY